MALQTFLIWYFVGYILSFILLKISDRIDNGNWQRDWDDIAGSFKASFLFFVVFIIGIIYLIVEFAYKPIIKYILKKQPPKWL